MIQPEKYFAKLAAWIELESTAERQRMVQRRAHRKDADIEKRGETLLDMVIADHHSGLGGRFLLSMVKRNRTLVLPWNRFRVGSPVVISNFEVDDGEFLPGVVCSRSNQAIQVAVDDWPEGDRFRLELSTDEITKARQLAAMREAQQLSGRASHLREILLGAREPRFGEPPPVEISADFNSSQQAAIRFALGAKDLAIIHGPPGTGKTTTVVEFVRQAVAQGQKVFATAPSNTAVDNLLERLVAKKVRVVRIGHPARVQEDLQSHTLDAIVEQDASMDIVQAMMREAEQLLRKASRYTRAKPLPGERNDLRREAKQLRDQARQMERQVVAHTLDSADVICATTTFDPDVLRDRRFDLAVVDEACQSTEPGYWPAVLRCDRIVLAGDHCQLPPTVLSVPAAQDGFSISMMERLVSLYGDQVTRTLRVQYRMHDEIMQFSSGEFYNESLVADPSVAQHRLCDMPGLPANPLTETPVDFFDTAGAGWEEEREEESESKHNSQEGAFLLRKADALIAAGLAPRDIAVIAPYAAQVRWLRDRSQHRDLEIDTIDGFQGREKEAVLISMVRSNPIGEIGFLGDKRRMNVALTRARRKLIVVGDSSTLAHHDFFMRLLQYFELIGAYRSVWEEYDAV